MGKSKKSERGRLLSAPKNDGGGVATEAIPTEHMDRAQMLEELSVADPGVAYDGIRDSDGLPEFSDDELRVEVASVREPPYEPPTPDNFVSSLVSRGEVPDAVADKNAPSADLAMAATLEDISRLEAEVAALKQSKSLRRVSSGSKPRPNVRYTLLSKPPSWHSTPQVAQLEQILFAPEVREKFGSISPDDGGTVVEVPEPELFALVEAGHAAGILRTRQNPVRIFQYYRSELLGHNVIRWK